MYRSQLSSEYPLQLRQERNRSHTILHEPSHHDTVKLYQERNRSIIIVCRASSKRVRGHTSTAQPHTRTHAPNACMDKWRYSAAMGLPSTCFLWLVSGFLRSTRQARDPTVILSTRRTLSMPEQYQLVYTARHVHRIYSWWRSPSVAGSAKQRAPSAETW